VFIVTGDTKVVERGRGDGLYINTTGIGRLDPGTPAIQPAAARPGDVILVNGDIGRHGIAIMAQREGMALETTLESDCADLSGLVGRLLDAGMDLHVLRDLTRGGLASALIEIAEAASVGMALEEDAIPVREAVQGACEILGFDPLYVANEGRMALVLPESQAAAALAVLRGHPLGEGAALIGRLMDGPAGQVQIRTPFGTERILLRLSGEQLPRIC